MGPLLKINIHIYIHAWKSSAYKSHQFEHFEIEMSKKYAASTLFKFNRDLFALFNTHCVYYLFITLKTMLLHLLLDRSSHDLLHMRTVV